MPIGERCVLPQNQIVYAHYIDDQGGWELHAQLHPLFVPGENRQVMIGNVNGNMNLRTVNFIWNCASMGKTNLYITVMIIRQVDGQSAGVHML